MINIKVHTCFLGHTGYAYHARSFTTALSKYRNVRVRNFTYDDNWEDYLTEHQKSLVIEQTLTDNDGERKDYPALWKNEIEYFEPDVDIVLMENNHHYYFDQSKYKGKIKIAYLVWESTLLDKDFFNHLIKNFDYFFCPSSWQKECMVRQGWDENKIFIVPEGVDKNLLPINNKKYLQSSHKFRFFLTGRWEYRKSTTEIISSFLKEFVNEDNVELVCSVDNPFCKEGLSTEQKLIKENFVSNKVKIIHFPDREVYIKLMQYAHCHLSCSRSEGWGLTISDAIACGTPTIYAHNTAPIDFAFDIGIPVSSNKKIPFENLGYYYEPDFTELQKKMRYIYENFEKEKTKALKHSPVFKSRYSWDVAASTALNILDSIKNPNRTNQRKKFVFVNFDSPSLGDNIAWMPYVEEFRKVNDVNVVLYSKWKNLFEKEYDDIIFTDNIDTCVEIKYCSEKIELIYNHNDLEKSFKENGLQGFASKILGFKSFKELKPKIHILNKTRSNCKKYVCIGTQSTCQAKYWTKEGWEKIIQYLKALDYEILCIDKYSSFGIENHMNDIPEGCIDKTGDVDIQERITDIINCDFFIGLSSGLSWLAWALNKPVVMISGFSNPSSEFFTPYRVFNENVCNSCWNDENCKFDRNDWLWCPRNKNFECSKNITPKMVEKKIDMLIEAERPTKETPIFSEDGRLLSSYETLENEINTYSCYQNFVKVEKGDTVLDLGCSNGIFYFTNKYLDIDYVGVEASIDCVKNFYEKLGKNDNPVVLNLFLENRLCIEKFKSIFHDTLAKDVNSITFSSLFKLINKKIDFLKFDIEGYEKLFLRDDYDLFKENVKKFSGEIHFTDDLAFGRHEACKTLEKIKNDNDIIFKLYSIDALDITNSFWSNKNYYTEIIIEGFVK